MSAALVAAVLLAAVLHAAWNALLRGGADRAVASALMCAASAAAAAPVFLVLPLPAPASWPYVAASGLLHVGYMLALVRTYRAGELGATYPIARGSSPALVALAAALVAGERLSPLSLLGLALVCGGILALALARRGFRLASLPAALATGAFIAAYTVVDGLGVRAAGAALPYTAALFLVWGLLMPLPLIPALRRAARPTRSQVAAGLGGGLVALMAYGIVIFALRGGAMGAVSALRETSVLFAALIGRIFLGEALTARRIAACAAISAGAACLALS